MLLLYYQFRLFTARIEIPCIIKRGKEVILWKYKFLTTLIRKNHTERTMFPCLRTARRFLPFHHREKHVVSIPAWNGYLGSGLHPLRMEAGVGSLFWFICFLQVVQTIHSRKRSFSQGCGRIWKRYPHLASGSFWNAHHLYYLPKEIHSRYTEFRGKTLSCRRKGNYKKWADFLHISLPVSAQKIICQWIEKLFSRVPGRLYSCHSPHDCERKDQLH